MLVLSRRGSAGQKHPQQGQPEEHCIPSWRRRTAYLLFGQVQGSGEGHHAQHGLVAANQPDLVCPAGSSLLRQATARQLLVQVLGVGCAAPCSSTHRAALHRTTYLMSSLMRGPLGLPPCLPSNHTVSGPACATQERCDRAWMRGQQCFRKVRDPPLYSPV